MKKNEHTNVSQQLKIWTSCSMNNQYVEVGSKLENGLLAEVKKMTITTWLYYSMVGAGN